MIFTRLFIASLLASLAMDRVSAVLGDCTSDFNCAASTCKSGGPATCVKTLAIGKCLCEDGTPVEQIPGVVPDLINSSLPKVPISTMTDSISTTTAVIPLTTGTGDDSITDSTSAVAGTGQDSIMDSVNAVTGLTHGETRNATSSDNTTKSIDVASTLVALGVQKVTDAQAATQKLRNNNLDDSLARLAKDQVKMALNIAYSLQDAKTDPSLADQIQKFVSAMTQVDMDATSAAVAPSVGAIIKLVNDLTDAQNIVSALSDAVKSLENKNTSLESTPFSSNATDPIDADFACPLAKRWKGSLRTRSTGHSRRLLQPIYPRQGGDAEAPAKGCYVLNFVAEINAPINVNEVPITTTCNSSKGPHTFAKQAILAALEQDARYALGDQIATPGGYPHAFLDLPTISPVTVSPSCTGKTVMDSRSWAPMDPSL